MNYLIKKNKTERNKKIKIVEQNKAKIKRKRKDQDDTTNSFLTDEI